MHNKKRFIAALLLFTCPVFCEATLEKSNNAYKIDLIYNSYTSRRGRPQILKIFCENCNKLLMIYQKDGPGELLRCYFDRIHLLVHEEEIERELTYKQIQNSAISLASCNLTCPYCSKIIGTPMLYNKHNEVRDAYRMEPGTFYFEIMPEYTK